MKIEAFTSTSKMPHVPFQPIPTAHPWPQETTGTISITRD